MIEISDVLKLERLRIYKTETTLFKFNPEKEQIVKLLNIVYPKLEIIFAETLTEKKIVSFIIENSNIIKNDSKKYYFLIGNSDPYYGSYLKVADKNINYSLITN